MMYVFALRQHLAGWIVVMTLNVTVAGCCGGWQGDAVLERL